MKHSPTFKIYAAALFVLAAATPSLAQRYIPAPTNASQTPARVALSGAGTYIPDNCYSVDLAYSACNSLNRAANNNDASGSAARASRQMSKGRAALAAGDVDAACQAFSAAQAEYRNAGGAGTAIAADMLKKYCTA